MTSRGLAAILAIIAFLAVTPGWAAELAPSSGLTVVGQAHSPVSVGPEELAHLPPQHVSVAFLTEYGPHQASFDGALLWSVLEKTGAIDPAKPRNQVAQLVVITGRDGYRAVLALAEIAPDFEGKSVILADRMDGKPLGAGHLRIVVPLDKHGGRSVRDVMRIQVLTAPP